MWMLWCSLAMANDDKAQPRWHRHTVSAGLGHHVGGLGVVYTYRPADTVDVSAGLGLYGVGLQGRYHPAPWKPLYVGAGVSPLLYSELFGSFYGPDLQVGIELRDTAFHLLVGLGAGVAPVPLGGWRAGPTVDILLGVNFVRPKQIAAP